MKSHRSKLSNAILVCLFTLIFHTLALAQVTYESDPDKLIVTGTNTTYTLLIDNLNWVGAELASNLESYDKEFHPTILASGSGTVEIGLIASRLKENDTNTKNAVVYACRAHLVSGSQTFSKVVEYGTRFNLTETTNSLKLKSLLLKDVSELVNENLGSSNAINLLTTPGGSTAGASSFARRNVWPRGSDPDDSTLDEIDLETGEAVEMTGQNLAPTGAEAAAGETAPLIRASASTSSQLTLRGAANAGLQILSGGAQGLARSFFVGVTNIGKKRLFYGAIAGGAAVGTLIAWYYSDDHIKTHAPGGGDSTDPNPTDPTNPSDPNNPGNSDICHEPNNPFDCSAQPLMMYLKVNGDVTLNSIEIPGITGPIVFKPNTIE